MKKILHSSGSTELEPQETLLEPAGPNGPGRSAGLAHHIPGESERVTVYGLARELEAPVAQVIQVVRQQLPGHRHLSALNPSSRIGRELAKVIRQTIAEAGRPDPPDDPRDVRWIG